MLLAENGNILTSEAGAQLWLESDTSPVTSPIVVPPVIFVPPVISDFERLQEIGSFDLEIALDFDVLKADYGAGYGEAARTGHPAGSRSWKLIYKVLPNTRDGGIWTGDETLESRAKYLWNFFARHKAAGNKAFIIRDPFNLKLYLAVFAEDRILYQMFAAQLFSTGLLLTQRRLKGLVTDATDGSLIVASEDES